MSKSEQLLVFSVEGLRFGLRLFAVERVLRMVELTPLPEATDVLAGLFNMEGRVVPVLNIRKKLHLPERDLALDDQLIVVHAVQRSIALPADSVHGVCNCPEQEVVGAVEIFPGMERFRGVMKLRGDLIFIYDLDGFLSPGEEEKINRDLSRRGDKEINASGTANG